MTDNEILKALECCYLILGCRNCPYNEKNSNNCVKELKLDTLSLINRQQAEIQQITEKFNCQQTVYADLSKIIKDQKAENERLKAENLILSQKRANIFEIVSANEKGRARGIKEFAERLKAEYSHTLLPPMGYPIDKNDWIVYREDVDDLVKEMIGENK